MNKLTNTKGWILGLLALISMLTIGCSGNMGMPTQHDMDMRLIRAAENGRMEEMKILIRRGADIDARDKDGWTPYLAAASMGKMDAMRLLKALGAKTTTYLEQGALALQ
jgi:ankyrin repeat protein